MSLVTTGGIAASIAPSILPFDGTYAVTVFATVMLVLFMLAMVFFAVAPVVSSRWEEEFGSDVADAVIPDTDTADDVPEDGSPADDSPEAELVAEGEDADAEPEPASSSEPAAASATSDGGSADDPADEGEDADDVTEGTFTNDELGKLVERADGKVIGTVASVDGERARVEPNPDALDQILVRLGRAEIGDPFIIEADDVREINDRRVHLTDQFVRPTGTSTTETDNEANDVSATTE